MVLWSIELEKEVVINERKGGGHWAGTIETEIQGKYIDKNGIERESYIKFLSDCVFNNHGDGTVSVRMNVGNEKIEEVMCILEVKEDQKLDLREKKVAKK